MSRGFIFFAGTKNRKKIEELEGEIRTCNIIIGELSERRQDKVSFYAGGRETYVKLGKHGDVMRDVVDEFPRIEIDFIGELTELFIRRLSDRVYHMRRAVDILKGKRR